MEDSTDVTVSDTDSSTAHVCSAVFIPHPAWCSEMTDKQRLQPKDLFLFLFGGVGKKRKSELLEVKTRAKRVISPGYPT